MPYGYNGKILRINLTTGDVSVEEQNERFYRTYGGGGCLGAYYLLKEQKKGTDPLGPENIIIFAGSAVNGAPVPGFPRYAIVSKSPLTGCIGESQAGGFWGPGLKFSGYDAIIVIGRANKPVYIWINNGKVEIRADSHLWGKTTGETQKMITKKLGTNKVRILAIGPAGENLVRFANVIHNCKHANGRNGLGAVMGSKNLKAIAVQGDKKIEMKNRDKVLEMAKDFATNFMERSPENAGFYENGTAGSVAVQQMDGQLPTRNWTRGTMEQAEDISGDVMTKAFLVGREGCYACPVKCKRVVSVKQQYFVDPQYGGPEYETLAALGSYCEINELAALCKANELCNKYGLDTISTGGVIAFAMECYERGIIHDEDTGGLKLNFGNAKSMLALIEMIANRSGLGDILAEGSLRASRELNKGAKKYAIQVKGQELPAHDPRVKAHLALGYAISPIGADHMQSEHDPAFVPGAPDFYFEGIEPLGVFEPMDMSVLNADKVRRFVYFQKVFSFMDSLLLCMFAFAPCRYYTFHDVVELISAITGWETSLWELMKLGERRIDMFRVFNVREGMLPKKDWLPERMFEPIQDGPRKGTKLEKEKLRQAIDLYYEMVGWNPASGLPNRGKLIELGLSWLTEDEVYK